MPGNYFRILVKFWQLISLTLQTATVKLQHKHYYSKYILGNKSYFHIDLLPESYTFQRVTCNKTTEKPVQINLACSRQHKVDQ